MYTLTVESHFDAAHALRGYKGKCEKLHGHTWKVRVFFSGEKLGKLGMLEDFKFLKRSLRECLDELDHGNLNELPAFSGVNPTSENVAAFIWKKLSLMISFTMT